MKIKRDEQVQLQEETPVEEVAEQPQINTEELEKWVEEALKDSENNENIPDEVEKEFDELREIKTQEETKVPLSNTDIQETLLGIKDFLIDMKKDELKIDNSILRKLENNLCVLKNIDNKYNKTTAVLGVLIFVVGVLFGIQYEQWTPYVAQILDFTRTTASVIK